VEFWQLPGPARFVEHVEREIERGSSAVLGLPARLVANDDWRVGFVRALPSMVDEVAAVGAAERPTASVVAEALGLEAELDHGAPALLARRPELEARVLLLHLADSGCEAEWATFCTQFVRGSKAVEAACRPQLVVLGGRELIKLLPASETSLVPLWWTGVMDRLDTSVYVAGAGGVEGEAEVLRESIVEVAGYDLGLALHLAHSWNGSEPQLFGLLRSYDAVDPPESGLPTARGDVHLGPDAELWDAGLLDRWDSRDAAHVHSSMLLALNRTDLIRARLWRAQLRTVMPVIDEHRGRIADWLRSEVREGYPLPEIPEPVDLYRAFQDHPRLKTWREGRRKRLVSWMRDSRNSLAHMRPLAMSEVRRGQKLMSEDLERN